MISIKFYYELSSANYKILIIGRDEFNGSCQVTYSLIRGELFKLFSFSERFEWFVVSYFNFLLLSLYFILVINSFPLSVFFPNFNKNTFEKQCIVFKQGSQCNKSYFLILKKLQEAEFLCKLKLNQPTIRRNHTGEALNNKVNHSYSFAYAVKIKRALFGNHPNKSKLIYPDDITYGKVMLEWNKSYLRKRTLKNINLARIC